MKKEVWIPDSGSSKKPSLICEVVPCSFRVEMKTSTGSKSSIVVESIRSDAVMVAEKALAGGEKYESYSITVSDSTKWFLKVMDPYNKGLLVGEKFTGTLDEAMKRCHVLRSRESKNSSHLDYEYSVPSPMQRGAKLGKIKGKYK